MEPERDVTDNTVQPDEPLFGLAVPPDARAATLTEYMEQADADAAAPFTGWTDHVRAP